MTAKQEHAELWTELEDSNRGLRRCACGSRVAIGYHPGVTMLWCIGEREHKMVLPDWQPLELKKKWNES